MFDSFHSWNASYFCGATELLASIARTAYMPQQVLNKFANKFELVEEGPGSFYINKNEECLYRTTQVDYFIEEYSLWREDDCIDWLNSYRGDGRAFLHVHTEIGSFLGAQEEKLTPRYHRIGRRDSENVHGTVSRPMWWAWD